MLGFEKFEAIFKIIFQNKLRPQNHFLRVKLNFSSQNHYFRIYFIIHWIVQKTSKKWDFEEKIFGKCGSFETNIEYDSINFFLAGFTDFDNTQNLFELHRVKIGEIWTPPQKPPFRGGGGTLSCSKAISAIACNRI